MSADEFQQVVGPAQGGQFAAGLEDRQAACFACPDRFQGTRSRGSEGVQERFGRSRMLDEGFRRVVAEARDQAERFGAGGDGDRVVPVFGQQADCLRSEFARFVGDRCGFGAQFAGRRCDIVAVACGFRRELAGDVVALLEGVL